MPTFLDDLTANPRIPRICGHFNSVHDFEDPQHHSLQAGCAFRTFIPARTDAHQIPERVH